jgi:hypothetical protein
MQSMFLVVLALTGLACSDSKGPLDPGATSTTERQYGTPVEVGKGRARTYIVVDRKTGNPVEVGVALDDTALDGLPAAGDQGGGGTSITTRTS